MMLMSFVIFMVLFVAVGLFSARFRQNTSEDYLVASGSIKPWMAGFSLFATENSGWMFVGYIGTVYLVGLSAIWILLGWYFGEILILWRAARIFKAKSVEQNAKSYAEILGNWHGQNHKYLRLACAWITIIFLSTYAAAQLAAGGKALNILMGIDIQTSAIIGFLMVVAYCWAGGIRATIWTDAVQSIVMVGSLIMIVGISLSHIGGFGEMFTQLEAIDPKLSSLTSDDYRFGFLLFVLGWVFSGVGILGQPHLMVRFMVLDKVENAKKTLLYYLAMVSSSTLLCTFAALCARLLVADSVGDDPELALPAIAAEFMPPVLAGLFLAGLFAAAMSTADSLVLSSSAALTHDAVPKYKDNALWNKVGTIFIASLALGIALMDNASVFKLVTFAWSVMSAGFAPLILVYTFNQKLTQAQALVMMVAGIAVALIWEIQGLSNDIYNAFPGIMAGLILFGIFKIYNSKLKKSA